MVNFRQIEHDEVDMGRGGRKNKWSTPTAQQQTSSQECNVASARTNTQAASPARVTLADTSEGNADAQPVTYLIPQDTYEKHRASLLDLVKANVDQHDKAVLQLSTATLGVSVTFVDRVITNPVPNTYWVLMAGWALLVTSMISMLVSFYTGKRACLDDLKKWDEQFQGGKEASGSQSSWSIATDCLTIAGSICFVLGLVVCLVFFWLNIGVPRNPSNLQKPTQSISHEVHASQGGPTDTTDLPKRHDRSLFHGNSAGDEVMSQSSTQPQPDTGQPSPPPATRPKTPSAAPPITK